MFRAGGEVVISKTPTAMTKLALSFNLKSSITQDTMVMFGIITDETILNAQK